MGVPAELVLLPHCLPCQCFRGHQTHPEQEPGPIWTDLQTAEEILQKSLTITIYTQWRENCIKNVDAPAFRSHFRFILVFLEYEFFSSVPPSTQTGKPVPLGATPQFFNPGEHRPMKPSLSALPAPLRAIFSHFPGGGSTFWPLERGESHICSACCLAEAQVKC